VNTNGIDKRGLQFQGEKMKKIFSSALILSTAIILITTIGCISCSDTKLRLDISLEKKEFSLGEKIRINFTLTNISTRSHTVTEMDFRTLSYSLSTNEGDYYYEFFGTFTIPSEITLDPNESIYHSCILPVKYFEASGGDRYSSYLLESGDYHVSTTYYCYDCLDDEKINSNTVHFHINDDVIITLQDNVYDILMNQTIRIPNQHQQASYPSFFQNNDGEYIIVWESGGFDYSSIYYSTSANGEDWSDASPLLESVGSRDYESPSMVQSEDGRYLLAYISRENETDSLFVTSSHDLLNWSSPSMVSMTNSNSSSPTLVIDNNGKYFLAWLSYGDEKEILFSSSVDGVAWTQPVVLSDRKEGGYSFLIDKDNVHRIVFEPTSGIYSMISSVDGVTWESPVELVTDIGFTGNPNLLIDSNDIYWSVWDGIDCSISADGMNWGDPIYFVIDEIYKRPLARPRIFQDSIGTYWVVVNALHEDTYDVWVKSFEIE
jgi:hypothetical protein